MYKMKTGARGTVGCLWLAMALCSLSVAVAVSAVGRDGIVCLVDSDGSYVGGDHKASSIGAQDVPSIAAMLMGVAAPTELPSGLPMKDALFERPRAMLLVAVDGIEGDILDKHFGLLQLGKTFGGEDAALGVSGQVHLSGISQVVEQMHSAFSGEALALLAGGNREVARMVAPVAVNDGGVWQNIEVWAENGHIHSSPHVRLDSSSLASFISELASKAPALDPSASPDARFLEELALLRVLSNAGAILPAKRMQENAPAFVSFIFSSIREMSSVYGAHSKQLEAVANLLEQTLPQILSQFLETQEGRGVAEVVYSTHSAQLVKDSYVSHARANFAFESEGLDAPRNHTYTAGEIATYQIELWISLLLAVVALAAVYATFSMSIAKDTMLFGKAKTD